MKILDGKLVSNSIKEEIKNTIEIEYIKKKKAVPCLACMIVGDNPASKVYVASKEKACKAVGIESVVVRLPENYTFARGKKEIEKLNADPKVSGILLLDAGEQR